MAVSIVVTARGGTTRSMRARPGTARQAVNLPALSELVRTVLMSVAPSMIAGWNTEFDRRQVSEADKVVVGRVGVWQGETRFS